MAEKFMLKQEKESKKYSIYEDKICNQPLLNLCSPVSQEPWNYLQIVVIRESP